MMEASERLSDPLSTHLYHLIDDDNLNKLRSVFGATGRGRRLNLPNLKTTHKLLIQLYYCKGTRTWQELSNFTQQFIDLDTERTRYLIEKTLRNALGKSGENLENFLQQEVLLCVGVQLSAAGLTRDIILKLTPQNPPLSFTNGMLIELENFRLKENLTARWLRDAVFVISSQEVKETVLRKNIKKLWSENKKKSKCRTRCPQQFQEFLHSKTTFLFSGTEQLTANEVLEQSTVDEDMVEERPVLRESPLTPAKALNSVETVTPENPKKRHLHHNNSPMTPQSQGMQIRKLNGTIGELEKQLMTEKDSVQTLQQLLVDGKTKSLQLEMANEQLALSVSKLETEIEQVRQALDDKKEKLSKLGQSAFYKRLKRKESKLKQTEGDLEGLVKSKFQQEQLFLKSKLRSAQTQLSNSRLSLSASKKETKHQKEIIEELKDNFVKLQQEESPKLTVLTRENGNLKFTRDIVKCVIQLIGETEVSGKNCGRVMQIVSQNLFNVHLDTKDLPSERSSLRFADQGHVLAKHQIAEALLATTHSDLHSDGTSKDHRKYVGHQLTLDSGETLSCGFTPVCQENTDTLVDIACGLLQELAGVYDVAEADKIFKSMLKNLSGLMSDQASVMKSFDKAFNDKRKNVLDSDEDMEFLHCNAHFLLGLSSAGDKVLKEWEVEQTTALGRDASGKFSSFASTSETSTTRLIRTACDILGPRGDEKNGCRDSWEAFCSLQDFPSHITSFKGNRFNNFFQAAAALHFHRDQITDFLQNFMTSLNRKQDSVLLDMKCETLDCSMIAIGLVYEKITGPYWQLMGKEIHYLDFYNHVCSMHEALTAWSVDATPMYRMDTPSLFGIHIKTPIFPALYDVSAEKNRTIISILQNLCISFKSVVERQLADFLPEGRYHDVQLAKTREKLSHSKITNLVGEECFGDLDFSIFKRRNSSIHHHSTVNMLKRNKTSAWFSTKSAVEQEQLLAVAAKKSGSMRELHQQMQREVVARKKNLMQTQMREKAAKAQKMAQKKRSLVAAVKMQGGPCLTAKCVANLVKSLATLKEKTEAVKNEIRYQKTILGAHSPLLKLTCGYKELVDNLQTYLTSDEIHQFSENSLDVETDCSMPDEETDDGEEDPHFGEFVFTKQGQNVAVYFDNEFYVGQVLECTSLHLGEVKFMDKCGLKKNVYRWPESDCVEMVEAMFVFSWDFELSTTNARLWSVHDHGSIQTKYKLYKELYC